MSKSKQTLLDSLDKFTQTYIECMLWSSTDDTDESGCTQLEDNYLPEDLTVKALKKIIQDCKDFQTSNASILALAYNYPNYGPYQAGYDFWLTRNGHGAGFWDRGFGTVGEQLTAVAKVYGSVDPRVYRKKIHL